MDEMGSEEEEAVMHDSHVPQPTAPSIIPPNMDEGSNRILTSGAHLPKPHSESSIHWYGPGTVVHTVGENKARDQRIQIQSLDGWRSNLRNYRAV